MMAGLSPHKEAGRAAMRELMAIKKSLDHEISKASPEFKQFLSIFAEKSKEAGRVRVGKELLDKSSQNLDVLGNPRLSPAKFANAAHDMDKVAKAATGFRRETAERLMTPDQRTLVANVRADLDRYARSLSQGKATGSPTAQYLRGAAKLEEAIDETGAVNALMPKMLSLPTRIFNGLNNAQHKKVLAIIDEVVMDPSKYAQISKRLTPAEQQAAMGVISRMQQAYPGLFSAGRDTGYAAAAASGSLSDN